MAAFQLHLKQFHGSEKQDATNSFSLIPFKREQTSPLFV